MAAAAVCQLPSIHPSFAPFILIDRPSTSVLHIVVQMFLYLLSSSVTFYCPTLLPTRVRLAVAAATAVAPDFCVFVCYEAGGNLVSVI